jgi:hypothetical protein
VKPVYCTNKPALYTTRGLSLFVAIYMDIKGFGTNKRNQKGNVAAHGTE